jgi:hypothetical protein
MQNRQIFVQEEQLIQALFFGLIQSRQNLVQVVWLIQAPFGSSKIIQILYKQIA